MNALADEILAVLHSIAPDVDPQTVDPVRPLADQLDLDSMDYQNFLAALGTTYAMPIPEADIAELRSIEDLTRYVELHRAPESRRI
jgi:acyl carrier protein